MIFYEVRENEDQMEGKGRQIASAYFSDEKAAVDKAKELGRAEVVKMTMRIEENTRAIEVKHDLVYGWRSSRVGIWGYGYIDLRDSEETEKEHREYLRLKKKFEV
jgi:hypothetical protein